MVVIETRRRSGSGQSRLVGLLLLLGGGIWLLNEAGLAEVSTQTLLSLILIVLGSGMMFIRPGGARAPLAIAGIVIASVLIFTPSDIATTTSRFGQFIEKPSSFAEVPGDYALVAGSLVVDLSEVTIRQAGETLRIRLAFGEVKLIVPEDMTISLDASGLAGEVVVDGRPIDEGLGFSSSRVIGPDDDPDISIDIEVAFGSVEVTHP